MSLTYVESTGSLSDPFYYRIRRLTLRRIYDASAGFILKMAACPPPHFLTGNESYIRSFVRSTVTLSGDRLMEYCVAATSDPFPDFVHISSRTVIIAAYMSEITSSLTQQRRWYMLKPRIVTFQMGPTRVGITSNDSSSVRLFL